MQLILRCDDIGYTHAFNEGVRAALSAQTVTHAEIFPDTPGAEEAMELLRGPVSEGWMSTAWHMHWWGRPCADPSKIPSLLRPDGFFKFRHDMWEFSPDQRKAHPEKVSTMMEVDENEAYIEMKAQIEKYIRHLGKAPDISSFIGTAEGPIARACDRVCREYGIMTNEDCHSVKIDGRGEWCPVPWSGRPGARYSQDSTIRNTQYDPLGYITEDRDGNLSKIRSMYVFHPGWIDDYMYEDYSFWYNYDHTYFDGCMLVDMLCLKSPKLRRWLIDNKVELITYMDAVNGTHTYQDHLKKIGSDLYMGAHFD